MLDDHVDLSLIGVDALEQRSEVSLSPGENSPA
jgi:hypothetical protein